MENQLKTNNKKSLKNNNVYEVEIVYKRPLFSETNQVETSFEVHQLFRTMFDPMRIDLKEFFFVMFLSNANKVLGISQIGMGDVRTCIVNTKEIFQLALKLNASAIILAHNHPSGKLLPSDADIHLTKKLQEGARLLDFSILDHLILTSESYYSFADYGKI